MRQPTAHPPTNDKYQQHTRHQALTGGGNRAGAPPQFFPPPPIKNAKLDTNCPRPQLCPRLLGSALACLPSQTPLTPPSSFGQGGLSAQTGTGGGGVGDDDEGG